MANPFRGETEMVIDDETYTLVIDIEALILVEEALAMSIKDALDAFDEGRLKTLRAFLWAALQAKHAPLNMLRAGELLGASGILGAKAALAVAVAASFPKADKGSPAGDEANPPMAAGGIGNGSTVDGAPSPLRQTSSGGKRRASSSPPSKAA